MIFIKIAFDFPFNTVASVFKQYAAEFHFHLLKCYKCKRLD